MRKRFLGERKFVNSSHTFKFVFQCDLALTNLIHFGIVISRKMHLNEFQVILNNFENFIEEKTTEIFHCPLI